MAASVEQAKSLFEEYITERLQFPEAFPYVVREPVASIHEIRKLQITPLSRSDYPAAEIVVTLRASLAGRMSHRNGNTGSHVIDVDVELNARGTVRADGTYDLAPRSATVKAWWRGLGSDTEP